jgi:Tol biopolymer transport system component
LNGVTAQALSGTDGADFPFWSPDSRSVGFFAGGKLKRIETDGGPPQTLADAPLSRGGTWNRDGVILFAPAVMTPLSRVSATGGSPQTLTQLAQGQTGYAFPQFLPDGDHFLFYARAAVEDQSGIYIGSLESTDSKLLIAADTAGLWAAPGWLLYMQQGTLRAQELDIAGGKLMGNPVIVANGVGYGTGIFNLGAFSASSSGIVAYRTDATLRTQLTWFGRTGNEIATVGDADESTLGHPELSPDGRRVAVDRAVEGNQDVWLIDLLRGGTTRFTFDPAIDYRPLWSPDGAQIVFWSNRNNGGDVYTKASIGVGLEQPLIGSPMLGVPYSWSADGQFLLYGDGAPRDVFAMAISGATSHPAAHSDQGIQPDRKPIGVATSPFDERMGQFSPDGRWVAYHSNESGRYEIYVVPFPAGGGKWQISTGGGISPRWRTDGKELFFIAPDAKMMAAGVSTPGTSFEAASPVALFQTRLVGGGANTNNKQQYAVSADGRFLINVPAGDSATAPITLILNWKPKP